MQQFQAVLLGRDVARTGHRALDGDGQRLIAQLLRTLDQFLGVARPAQEREVHSAKQMSLGIQPNVRNQSGADIHWP